MKRHSTADGGSSASYSTITMMAAATSNIASKFGALFNDENENSESPNHRRHKSTSNIQPVRDSSSQERNSNRSFIRRRNSKQHSDRNINNNNNRNDNDDTNDLSKSPERDVIPRSPSAMLPDSKDVIQLPRPPPLQLSKKASDEPFKRLEKIRRPSITETFFHDLGSVFSTDSINGKEDNCDAGDDIGDVEEDLFMFIRAPIELEKVLAFGFLLCMDSTLYLVTFLPLRILFALIVILGSILLSGFKLFLNILLLFGGFHQRRRILNNAISKLENRFKITAQHVYDISRGLVILSSLWGLHKVSISQIYHFVRGQSFLKVYAFLNILDVFDALLNTVGHNIADSFYRLLVICFAKNASLAVIVRIVVRFMLLQVYTMAHSLLYFARLITLNVALDSSSSTFISIIFSMELVADWIKHGFILKFNNLSVELYSIYADILCLDILYPNGDTDKMGFNEPQRRRIVSANSDGKKKGAVDTTQAASRRLGFFGLPFICVAFRMMSEQVMKLVMWIKTSDISLLLPISSPQLVLQQSILSQEDLKLLIFILICWAATFMTKVALRKYLIRQSFNYLSNREGELRLI